MSNLQARGFGGIRFDRVLKAYSGSTMVSKTIDGGSIPSESVCGKSRRNGTLNIEGRVLGSIPVFHMNNCQSKDIKTRRTIWIRT